ncbi:unnamed protein product [Didymodactylos carnosus]|uniref:Uncharacterized protein n=1 Tax=Didymodactylos carnosus TaxID=1234261 RepID=A0A814G6V8_9BILA|nr:unnamed protein product [Didymodactylos carnosus]CAF3764401.1 unnamed protein product [Didymodactylos carnosus]
MRSPTFLGDKGLRTLFNIECKQGKAIQTHSYFKEESEVLLMPRFYFKVTDEFRSGDGLNIIHLCETTPDYELIKPPFPNQTPLTLPSMVQAQLQGSSFSVGFRFRRANKTQSTWCYVRNNFADRVTFDNPQYIKVTDHKHAPNPDEMIAMKLKSEIIECTATSKDPLIMVEKLQAALVKITKRSAYEYMDE